METLSRQTLTDARFSTVSVYMNQVYMWMTVGLGLTAIIAWQSAQSLTVMQFIFGKPFVFIGLIVAQLGIVLALSAAVHRMSASTATALFLLYSGLTGVTMASIFIVYPIGSIANAFFVAAGTFGAMSVYGTVTKRNLTGLGSFMFMGLIGIIIASVVNFFLKSPAVDFAISAIGVIVFTGLTAYDTQKIRRFGMNAPLSDTVAIRRGAILGALTLYLDFINLFLMLLRLFGRRN